MKKCRFAPGLPTLCWCALALASIGLCACRADAESADKRTQAGYTRISPAVAQQRMATEKEFVLVDVRTPEEYAEAHIPGAINVPLGELETLAPRLLPDKGQPVIVYCRSGRRSKAAGLKLAAAGYARVADLGGIIDWPGEKVRGTR